MYENSFFFLLHCIFKYIEYNFICQCISFYPYKYFHTHLMQVIEEIYNFWMHNSILLLVPIYKIYFYLSKLFSNHTNIVNKAYKIKINLRMQIFFIKEMYNL